MSELQSLGVEAFAYDGELRANVNGLTVRDTGEAATLRDGSVGVPNRSAGELTPKEIAAHEAYHSMSRRGVSEAAAFSRAVEEHVLVSSELAEAYIGDISDNYFNGKYNRNDPRHRQKLLDELCAYLSGDLYEAAVDVSGMFDDYGAVKAAWERMMGTARQSGGDGLGAAEAGEMGSFTRMQNESETFHPVNLQAAQTTERMRGRAPEEVPVINPRTGRPVSKTVSTILNSPLTSNDMAVEIEGAVADGTFDYVPVTDRDAHARAQRSLSREGLQAVAARFFAKIELGQRITKADMAEGIAAYNQAVETGDRMTAFQLMSSIADAAHDGAQVTQAMNLMNRLTPEGRLLTLRRYVDRLNDRASTRPSRRAAPAAADPEAARADYVERATGFAVSDELASAYLLAETDAERAAAWDAITTDLAGQIPSTFREKADFWRYTSMLLNPTTHARNFLGNAIQAGARKIKNGVGAAIERAAVRDRRARTKSLLNPMGKEDRALTAFARERYAADQRAAMGAGKYTDGSAAGIGREIQEKRRTFQGKNPVSRAVQAAGDFNTRLLDAEDVLFNRPAYVESFAQALKAKGVTAEEAASGAKADLVEAARAYAIEEAQRATYRNTTALSDTLSRLGRYNPEANAVEKAGTFIADALLPFRRTPANILTTGLDYSPLGFAKGVKEALLDVRQGKCTAADAVDALASGLTGTGILAVGAYLAAEGIFGATLHVRAGDDDREEAFNKSAGIQGYALRIGDKSYTLDWALPAAMPLFAGAAIMESAREGGSTLEGVLDAMTGISEVVLETSMLSSLNDLISNWSYADNKITYLLDRAASSYAGQYAPTLGGKVASALDDTVRKSYVEKGTGQAASDADYFLQSILKKIPGARKTLQPAVDLWGREVSNGSAGERVFQSFLSPGYLKTVDDGPVDRELRRLHAATGSSAVYPAEAEKSFTVHGETKYLTAEEYTKYAKTLGKTRYDAVTALVNNAGYKKLSDEEKARAVSDAYEYAKVIGKQAVSRYKPADSSFAKGAMNSVLPIDSYILYQINADRDRSGGVTSVESAETLWELSGVSDRQRGDAWRQKNSATSPEKNPFTGALPAAGVDTKTAIAVLDQYRTLNNSEGMRPREKAAAFKRYVNGLGLTKEQVRAVQDTYTFFGSYPVSW